MSRPVGLAAFWGLVATLSLSPLSSLQAKDLVVVQVAAQSGPQGVSGRAIGAGAKLYFDHINANGGIDGATIRLITHDDALKPEETVRLVRESIAHESPVAFLGMTGGNNVEAVVRDGALARNNIPLVGAVPFTPVIGKPSIFTIKASHSSELEHLFSHLSQLGMTTVGVVHQEDSLGNDIANSSKSAATRLGIKLVAICPYERNTTQVGAAVETMLKAKPMSIFLGMPTKGAIEFIKQYRQRGGAANIFGLSIIDTDILLSSLGPELARGFGFSVVVPRENQSIPMVREYLKLKAASKSPDLSARSMEGFIAAKALVAALQKSAKNPTETQKTLSGMSKLDLGGYTVNLSSSGQSASDYVDFAMFGKNGSIIQ